MATHQIILSFPDHPEASQNEMIQQALDSLKVCGGEVVIGPGEWHIASLRLYSGITLHLQSGAHLIGSDNWKDYTNFHIDSTLGYLHSPLICKQWNLPDHYVNAMITAVNAEEVSVIGEPGSLIDGQDCCDPNGEEHFRGPMGMVFSRCRNVTLKGYTIQNTANWCHQLDSCCGVSISDLTILGGHDGVNLHHCVGIVAENCDIRSGDDCFAGYDVENLVVRNCKLNTSCNSFRIGGKNILVEHCQFWGPGEYPHRSSGRHNTLVAFMYYAMWYDDIRFNSSNWVIRDCTFDQIDRMFHYSYGRLWDHNARPLEDVTLENVKITNLLHGSILQTQSGSPLTVRMHDVSVSWRSADGPYDRLATSDEIRFNLDNVRIQGINA